MTSFDFFLIFDWNCVTPIWCHTSGKSEAMRLLTRASGDLGQSCLPVLQVRFPGKQPLWERFTCSMRIRDQHLWRGGKGRLSRGGSWGMMMQAQGGPNWSPGDLWSWNGPQSCPELAWEGQAFIPLHWSVIGCGSRNGVWPWARWLSSAKSVIQA